MSDFNDVESTLLELKRGAPSARPTFVFRDLGGGLFEVGDPDWPRRITRNPEALARLHRLVAANGRRVPLDGLTPEAFREHVKRPARAIAKLRQPLGEALLAGIRVGADGAWYEPRGDAMPPQILTSTQK